MMPVVHFILSLGVAFCLEFKHKRRFAAILALGILGTLPDIDHFLPTVNGVGIFHNTFILGAIPLFMMISANLLETYKTPSSSVYQRFFICATVVLVGHLLLDLIAGNAIFLGLPYLPGMLINIDVIPLWSSSAGIMVTSTDMLWLVFTLAIISGNRVQKAVYEIYEGFAVELQFIEESIEAENRAWNGMPGRPRLRPGHAFLL